MSRSKTEKPRQVGETPSLPDRMLQLAGPAPMEQIGPKLLALRRFLLCYAAVRSWLWVVFLPGEFFVLAPASLFLSALAAWGWNPRRTALATRGACALVAWQAAWAFPLTDNHMYLEVITLLVLSLGDPQDKAHEQAAFRGLLWVCTLVMFHTGLQKLTHGLYFGGEFFAWMLATGDRFTTFFSWLVDSADLDRLAQLDPMKAGSGPYRLEAPLLVVASNLIWVFELAIPFALFAQRTRTIAATVSIAFVVAIQLAAREIGFAVLFTNLLFLFLPGNIGGKLLPFFLGLFAYGVAAKFGVVPGGAYFEVGNL